LDNRLYDRFQRFALPARGFQGVRKGTSGCLGTALRVSETHRSIEPGTCELRYLPGTARTIVACALDRGDARGRDARGERNGHAGTDVLGRMDGAHNRVIKSRLRGCPVPR
jgi:hypothetical protein